ncbi:tetratricopeptide repeat protein [Kitasatospora sp. NPDC004289]
MNVINLPPSELRPPAEARADPRPIPTLDRHATFIGRERELALLDSALGGTGTAVVLALHGLGGIGKTTLAAHWAATRAGTDTLVWWITADTPAALDQGLARLAMALPSPPTPAADNAVLAEHALQWLATRTGWLLILDNVDSPSDVRPLLARASTGRVLITTRRASGWHDTATAIGLDVLCPSDALHLLRSIVAADKERTVDLDGAAELCAMLGHLPLAIEQAGAYMFETGATPRDYLASLAEEPAALYKAVTSDRTAERTVARVWRVSLDRLTADTPLAGHILRILAWCAPDGIPRSLFRPLGTNVVVDLAIGRLAAYSMLTINGDKLSVHRLVQSLARTPDSTDPHRRAEDIAAALDDTVLLLLAHLPGRPDEPSTWVAWRTLLPHINALADHSAPDDDSDYAASLFAVGGRFLAEHGDLRRAVTHLERTHAHRMRVLGEDHRETLLSRNNLALLYLDSGDSQRALAMQEQTLRAQVRLFGETHPNTLRCRNNLAITYQSTGDLARATPMFHQVFEAHTLLFGPRHPGTLASRGNLANAYASQGDLARAVILLEQNLAETALELGDDDARTLICRSNLASAYESAGDLARAVRLYEQVLRDRVRIIGEDHPATLLARNNLAYAYQAAGDTSRALPLYERTLADRSRILGEDHPDTEVSRANLAQALRALDGTPPGPSSQPSEIPSPGPAWLERSGVLASVARSTARKAARWWTTRA